MVASNALTHTGGVFWPVIEEAVGIFIDDAVAVVVDAIAKFLFAGGRTGVFTAVAGIPVEVLKTCFTVIAATHRALVVDTLRHFVGAGNTSNAAATTVIDGGGTLGWDIINVAIAVVV